MPCAYLSLLLIAVEQLHLHSSQRCTSLPYYSLFLASLPITGIT
ncbi:hypothetical protein COO91_01116 [Nostoc flagelliforme CCNUN1]|uniref:Uncharacterized protein n=1 Tax=Nostoc flagelliforme CCNUN1 TaxID=2038116 RepID=A0A2K8SIT0_9NOSO|nr:hypothetical protein COO91_01116 [Nostoc flagelliforme CCNUN1]